MQNSLNWSRLGLGTGTLASLGRAATVSELDGLVGAMLGMGITVIDTADSYGSGNCERLLGKVLKGKRDSVIVTTKAGYRFSDLLIPLRPLNQFVKKGLHHFGYRQLFTPSYLAKSLDGSLRRLSVEHVDAFLLHSPSVEVVKDEGVAQFFRDLIKSGKATQTGVSSENPQVIRAAIASGVFGIIQTPANLKAAVTLRDLWNECEACGIRVIGNHVFDPTCLAARGMTHEVLMRASSSLLPNDATILCGTRNPSHLRQANQWAREAMDVAEAELMALKLTF